MGSGVWQEVCALVTRVHIELTTLRRLIVPLSPDLQLDIHLLPSASVLMDEMSSIPPFAVLIF